MEHLHERIARYVERSFQKSGMTEFPTVRQVARALGLRQGLVEAAIDDDPTGRLMLTFWYAEDQRLGDHFMETLW